MMFGLILLLACCLKAQGISVDFSKNPPDYGVDCSWPIHYGIDREKCPFFYDSHEKLLAGCHKLYSKKECDADERGRLEQNLEQAKSQHNYTELGFKKMKAPKEAWEPLIKFYNDNKKNMKLEKWYRGSTIVNNWDSPSYMISFEEPSFKGGIDVKQAIWDHLQPVIEEWVGRRIEPTSLYGIRIYSGGSVLATHVDRLPLISSCIVNVAQDVDEPWPIEVYDHNGKAYNVTMEPGDIVLYESSTVLHGRPFPMKGRFYANIFVHYKPIDHDELNERDRQLREMGPNREPMSIRRRHGSNLRRMADEEEDLSDGERFRLAAAAGKVEELKTLLSKDRSLIDYSDENRWLALHEAARSGSYPAVKFLVENGADISSTTNSGYTVLDVAKEHLIPSHKVIMYLKDIGAPSFGGM